ncbi:MAG: hypothetical protein NUV77_17235, partial [Thermoguttaceae bacterium]|nr:hypothetical protein [Thermoguttaceae bacterium]
LGVEFPTGFDPARPYGIDARTRGPDLLVTRGAVPETPVQMDAMWRAIPPGAGDRFLAAVDLVVSVRTDLFDIEPRLLVRSTVAGVEAIRLAADGQSTALGPGPELLSPVPGVGTACLLVRTAISGLSYAEMVHPADIHESLWHAEAGHGGSSLVQHRLFRERLERGVILRARVRGVVLPREGDASIAAACYAAFAAAEPPLGA